MTKTQEETENPSRLTGSKETELVTKNLPTCNRKRAGMAILTTDGRLLRQKLLLKIKEGHFIPVRPPGKHNNHKQAKNEKTSPQAGRNSL